MFPTRFFSLRYWTALFFPRGSSSTSLTCAFIRCSRHTFTRAGLTDDILES